MGASEFDDEYSESLETEFRKLQGALLSDRVELLAPSEPIKLPGEATVQEAIETMVAHRRSAMVVVDPEGRLVGIFTDRDVLTRVAAQRRDPERTRLDEVMTRDPDALFPDDRICYAVNRMTSMGYRTVPLVDADRRPIGIVTVNDVVRWLAELFPEAVINLRPGDRIKRPLEVDTG